MTAPNLTDAERLAAQSFGMSAQEYVADRDNGNSDDLDREAGIARKAAEQVDHEQAVAAERARRVAR